MKCEDRSLSPESCGIYMYLKVCDFHLVFNKRLGGEIKDTIVNLFMYTTKIDWKRKTEGELGNSFSDVKLNPHHLNSHKVTRHFRYLIV